MKPFCLARDLPPRHRSAPDDGAGAQGRSPSCYESGPGRRLMTTSVTITGARTMWELVDRRAQTSADHPLLIAADGEVVTCGHSRTGRSGSPPACRIWASRPVPSCRGSSRPASTRSCCPWRWPGSAPCRTRSSTSTGNGGGLRSPSDRGAAVRHPRHMAGHRLRRHCDRALAGANEPARHPHHR